MTYKKLMIIALLILLVVGNNNQGSAQSFPDYDPDFFFNGISADCNMPCWYGLEIGAASEPEFLTLLNSFKYQSEPNFTEATSRFPYDVWSVEQKYDLVEDSETYYGVGTQITVGYLSEETLIRLSLIWNGELVKSIPLKDIFSSIGIPENIYLAIHKNYGAAFWLNYETKGIDVTYQTIGSNIESNELCLDLDDSTWDISEVDISFTTQQLPTPEQYFEELVLPTSKSHSLESVTDITVEDIVEAITTGENPCITYDPEIIVED